MDLQEKLSIMIVDDDLVSQSVTRKIAERSGCIRHIQVAGNGVEALQKLVNAMSQRHQLPDIILLDINMPLMDGFQFLAVMQQLKLQMQRPPAIIVVSSATVPADQLKLGQLGVYHVIEKPFSTTSFSMAMLIHSAYAQNKIKSGIGT